MGSQWWETKGTKNNLRYNLEWHPKDEKAKELRINWYITREGIPMMRDQNNKRISLDKT